jgi:F-type H+/Na+-transporting ATPase subunit beta
LKIEHQAINKGTVKSVKGSVVDIFFGENLPPIHTLTRAGRDKGVAIEVQTQLDRNTAGEIALTPAQGLARGMIANDTGGQIHAPVGNETLSRMFWLDARQA